jgi:hypothetical protein
MESCDGDNDQYESTHLHSEFCSHKMSFVINHEYISEICVE